MRLCRRGAEEGQREERQHGDGDIEQKVHRQERRQRQRNQRPRTHYHINLVQCAWRHATNLVRGVLRGGERGSKLSGREAGEEGAKEHDGEGVTQDGLLAEPSNHNCENIYDY